MKLMTKSAFFLLTLTLISSLAEARSILTFKSVDRCYSIARNESLLVVIQEAQDGQAQLVITDPLEDRPALNVQVKKYTPPVGNMGGSVSYSGKTSKTKESVTLAYNGIRPITIGTVTGRSATLKRERMDDVALICSVRK